MTSRKHFRFLAGKSQDQVATYVMLHGKFCIKKGNSTAKVHRDCAENEIADKVVSHKNFSEFPIILYSKMLNLWYTLLDR